MELRNALLSRLRMLDRQPRGYAMGDATTPELERKGLATRTGRIDARGRTEWAITEAGRDRLEEGGSAPG